MAFLTSIGHPPGTWRDDRGPVRGAVAAGTGLTGTAQQPTFRRAPARAALHHRDRRGGRPDPIADQFTVLDNGKVQNLTVRERVAALHRRHHDGLLASTANLDRLKQATEQFLIRMLPADKAQVGAFSDKIQFSGTFTNDRDDLIGALRDLQFGNPTRLYDAIYESIDMLGEFEV
jgi:hypothetical protein